MIGLEYICKQFDTEYKEVANKLEITPQTLNSWLRGKRKIPKVRLKQLSELFDVDESYFDKELNKIDKINIQVKKIEIDCFKLGLNFQCKINPLENNQGR